MEIIKQLNQVMEYVGAVHKSERNTHQSFNFRGIDNVVNAVSPALRKHGVVVVPCVNSSEADTLEIGQNRTRMGYVRVNVTYTFYALDGSNIATTVVAESMDSGDKATAKAMSVAFRTALLQTLCLPTDDLDPDADTYVRRAAEPQRSASVEAPQRSASKRAAVGSKSEPAISDNQLKFLRELAIKVDADDATVVALAGGIKIEALSNPQASKIIEQLLSIKRGDATLTFNTDGTAELTTTK
jgi:hypothetical protein